MRDKGAEKVQNGPAVDGQVSEITETVGRTRVRIPLGSPHDSPVITGGAAHVGGALPPQRCNQGANPGASDGCSNAAPCDFCGIGGRVACTGCGALIGCHLTPTPLLCSPCKVAVGLAPAAPVAGSPLVVPAPVEGRDFVRMPGPVCQRRSPLPARSICICAACAPRSPVHGMPTAGYADAATPEPIIDEPATARVLTPTDAQLRAERLLGLHAIIACMPILDAGRETWRLRITRDGVAWHLSVYGDLDYVVEFARSYLEKGGAL